MLIKAKKDSTDAKQIEEEAVKECDETRKTLEATLQNLEDYKLELADVQGKLSIVMVRAKQNSEEKSAMLKNLETRLSAMQVTEVIFPNYFDYQSKEVMSSYTSTYMICGSTFLIDSI